MFEILIPKRPVSVQARNRKNLQAWKDYVSGQIHREWQAPPLTIEKEVRLTLVYLCSDDVPIDVDNIIKPIQDALVGVILIDDKQVTDTDSHRRFLSDPIDITNLPPHLQIGVLNGVECVYIRVSLANTLDSYL